MCGGLSIAFWIKEGGKHGPLPFGQFPLQEIVGREILVGDKLPNKFLIEILPMKRFGDTSFRHSDVTRQLGMFNAAVAELSQAILNDVGHAPHHVPTFRIVEIEGDFPDHKHSFLINN